MSHTMRRTATAQMDWFEAIDASRGFSIVFGTITAGLCLSIAIPMLWWTLPAHRIRVFNPRTDDKLYFQAGYGIAAMAMGWANALCRYIPHARLGLVHPAFFVTTLLLVGFLGPRVARRLFAVRRATASKAPARFAASTAPARLRIVQRLSLALVLAVAVAIPMLALVGAFAPHGAV
jgi:hypothetical protein